MKRTLYIALLALMASGCIYPFEPEETESVDRPVIEGDITIGDVAYFSVSSVQTLAGLQESRFTGELWVEDDQGTAYYPSSSSGSEFEVDLTDAPEDRNYRLRVNVRGSNWTKEYSSSWKKVQPSPTLNDVVAVEVGDELLLKVSMESPAADGCYRWDYDEDWQYHAKYASEWGYDPDTEQYIRYAGTPYFWCWGSASSRKSGLAIAKTLKDQKLVEHTFLSIPRISYKLQTLYSIKVRARSISSECYEYLHTLELNSDATSSLLTPNPSAIEGNIRNMADTTDCAVGYVEVAKVTSKRIYVDDSHYKPVYSQEEDLFQPALSEEEQAAGVTIGGKYYITMDARPAYPEMMNGDKPVGMWWSYRYCVDCRAIGGTKNKPSWWPREEE